ADARIALYQGGVLAERNLETLVKAARFLRDPRARIVFMGAGDHLPPLKALAARLGVADRVLFHPEVAQDDLLRHTRAAHVGVIPSQATCLNNYYCTPNKLFEFIAVGLPIVATDLPELRRFVAGYRIGSVGDTSSPEKLAALIEALMSSDEALAQARAMLR